MIRIQSFDEKAFAAQFEEGGLERQILEQLSAGKDIYQYPSADVLKFEISLRREIEQASMDLYQSRMGFAVFEKTRCNPEFWDRTPNGGFLLKNGVKPSDAVADIYASSKKYATECATAMVIVYYKALLEVWGAALFDKTFQSVYLMNWSVREPLLREVSTPRKAQDYIIGDRAYFINPDVSPEVPWWQGENVIVLPDGQYYGHGIGVQTADVIIHHLNSQRKDDSTVSAYLLDSLGRPSFQKLYRAVQAQDTPAQEAPAQDAQQPARLVWRPFPAPVTRTTTV